MIRKRYILKKKKLNCKHSNTIIRYILKTPDASYMHKIVYNHSRVAFISNGFIGQKEKTRRKDFGFQKRNVCNWNQNATS